MSNSDLLPEAVILTDALMSTISRASHANFTNVANCKHKPYVRRCQTAEWFRTVLIHP